MLFPSFYYISSSTLLRTNTILSRHETVVYTQRNTLIY